VGRARRIEAPVNAEAFDANVETKRAAAEGENFILEEMLWEMDANH
jgi:hypothetical protein